MVLVIKKDKSFTKTKIYKTPISIYASTIHNIHKRTTSSVSSNKS